MIYKPHQNGRLLEGDTQFGKFRIVWNDQNEVVEMTHEPREPKQPTGLSRIAHGAAGLAKATLGIDQCSESTQANRRAICKACPLVQLDAHGDIRRCSECGCWLKKKITLAGEACPHGKWSSERTGDNNGSK